jgi:hypothetical protein
MCTRKIPGKHRKKQVVANWFEAEREPRSFQGGEE